MKRGLVIGKFHPPHKGHSYLIETALNGVPSVTVIVCGLPGQSIPGSLRVEWLKEIHPQAEVILVDDIGHDDDSQLWADYTRRVLGWTPDVVFTSEDYGEAYARYLGCEHRQVDKARAAVPVSGRQVRENPLAWWDYLSPCVRGYFARRICVLGAESTGTTTMARALASRFQTVWVPEVGRTYSEAKLNAQDGDLWRSEEFTFIAETQNRLEDQLARICNRLLICDTNSFATRLWQERYVGSISPEVIAISNARPCNLYLLTDADIPFVQDGFRDGEKIRMQMHRRFEQELAAQDVPYVLLSGPPEQRLEKAVEACEAVLKTPWPK